MLFDFFDVLNSSDFFAPGVIYRAAPECPVCGMTYSEFRQTGKVGCSECYKTFREPLLEVLKQVHRNAVHAGKVPAGLKAEISKKQLLKNLKEDLQNAISNEKYEDAAKIHKKILEIEKG